MALRLGGGHAEHPAGVPRADGGDHAGAGALSHPQDDGEQGDSMVPPYARESFFYCSLALSLSFSDTAAKVTSLVPRYTYEHVTFSPPATHPGGLMCG